MGAEKAKRMARKPRTLKAERWHKNNLISTHEEERWEDETINSMS
jgi:hypothetical protein